MFLSKQLQLLEFEHILQLYITSQQEQYPYPMEDAFSDFKSWYLSKPLVTRTYLTGVFILAAVASLTSITPYSFTYTFRQAFMQFEIWRLFTAGFFLSKFSFSLIFQMYFAYMFLSKTQTQIFNKETYADFLWLLSYLVLSLIFLASIITIQIYSFAFLMALTYIYCKRRPHEEFKLMFGFTVKSGYFPFVWTAIKVLLFQQSLIPNLMGLGLGHLYIYLKDIHAVQYHKDYLATPGFLKRWWYKAAWQRVPNQPSRNRGNVFQGVGVRLG